MTCAEAPTVKGTALCAVHYVETMAAVRASMHRNPKRRPDDEPARDIEADARTVVLKVLETGGRTRQELRGSMPEAAFNVAAVEAVSRDWIVRDGNIFRPGSKLPDRVPVEVRATMLVRWLRAQPEGWVPANTAAQAIGFKNKTGAYVRVAKLARERGEMESSNQGVRAIRDRRRHVPADEMERRREVARRAHDERPPTREEYQAAAERAGAVLARDAA